MSNPDLFAANTMKALVYHGPGKPAWENKPRPTSQVCGCENITCGAAATSDRGAGGFMCSELTVHGWKHVQSSTMTIRNSNKKSERATLDGIKEEMAKPRVAKSARRAKRETFRVFPLSGGGRPG
jgi:hypothetical protein